MGAQKDYMRNVGTPNSPLTWLHERTVALLYDELQAGLCKGTEVRARTSSDGEMSGNLLDGARRIDIPDDLTPIGGTVPDLALYNDRERPVRIIEVVVTSAPNEKKREKFARLEDRGVDVVVITVKTPDDLLSLCWVPKEPEFSASWEHWPVDPNSGSTLGYYGMYSLRKRDPRDIQEGANKKISELIQALTECAPGLRHTFLDVLGSLKSLESLYPVSPKNPKRAALGDTQTDGAGGTADTKE